MRSNRRSFLQQSSLAIAACSFTNNQKAQGDPPFVHHVLFWLKDKSNMEVNNRVLKALQEFRKIKEVKFLHVGVPSISDVDYEARATDDTYTFSYLTLFESKADKETYLKSPLHNKFLDDFKDAVSRVVIYDSLNISS